MNSLESLNNKYSTTKLCYKLLNDEYLDENGKIKDELKFKINKPEFGIVDSKIPAKEGEKFDTLLFLPEGEGRKGEGGLRTKGYFKFSYENLMMNDECLILNDKYGNKFGLDKNTLNNSTLNQLPLISIVTVVYNGEKYLEETIQSVINQTYPNVEYIIIDGGSTDGTLDIIKKYEDYIDYWVSERDKGIYDAMNKGVLCTNGQIIGLINSDDFYEKNIFNLIVEEFNRNDNIAIIHGDRIDYFSANNKKLNEFNDSVLKLYYYGMTFHHPTMFVLNDYYKKYGLYNIKLKILSDYEFILKAVKKHKVGIKYLNIQIANYRLAGASTKISLKNVLKEGWISRKNAGFSIVQNIFSILVRAIIISIGKLKQQVKK